MSGIMLGNSPAKLYLGDILLTGGGGYTDEDIVEMSWKILAENYTPTFAILSKAETPYAFYWRCWTDVAWNMELVPYDYTENFTKVYAKMRASTLYNNQGSYSGSTLTPPILIPNSTSNSKWLQMSEHLTVPCKFEVKNLTNMSACHPAISDRYTFTEGGWYTYTDLYDFSDIITLDGASSSDYLFGVTFSSGRRIFRYTSQPVFEPYNNEYRTQGNPNVIRYQLDGVIGTAYTAKTTLTSDLATFTINVTDINFATFDVYDTNGNLLFAKNADITDFVAT
jgi:hypothetical protein